MPTARPRADRSAMWLPLLRQLTEEVPEWSAWKGLDSGLHRLGDIDSLAPPARWSQIEAAFRTWAAWNGFAPMIVCRHIPQGPHLITLSSDSQYLIQLDVKERATFRGATLLDVPALLEMAIIGPEGVRSIRTGAEGVIRLLNNGTRRGGGQNAEGLKAKNVAGMLAEDPEGVAAMAARFGPARGALIEVADAVVRGEWNARAMLAVEAWAWAKALAEPTVALSRLRFNLGPEQTCPVIRLIRRDDRKVPDDRDAWLRGVAESHTGLGEFTPLP